MVRKTSWRAIAPTMTNIYNKFDWMEKDQRGVGTNVGRINPKTEGRRVGAMTSSGAIGPVAGNDVGPGHFAIWSPAIARFRLCEVQMAMPYHATFVKLHRR